MKNLKVLVATFALLLAANFANAQSLDDAAGKYSAGIEKYKSADYSAAAALLKEAMNMGIDLGEEGMDLVKEVQGLLPKVYLQYGVAELRAQNYDAAIAQLIACEEIADLYGDVQTMRQASRVISGAYQMQGATAFNDKDYKTALESFSKGYAQDPSNVKLAALTAKAYAELGELDKAMPIYAQVVEAAEKNSKFADDSEAAQKDVAMYVGVAVSNAAEAKDMDKVLSLAELAPTNPDVAILVLQTANNMKNYQAVIARAEAAAALQVTPEAKSNVYFLLGAAYNNTANLPKAIEALSKVTAGPNAAAAKALVAELKK